MVVIPMPMAKKLGACPKPIKILLYILTGIVIFILIIIGIAFILGMISGLLR